MYLSLQEFAGDGLRTLALAYKDLDEEYFNQWKQRHHEASTELEDRESKLDELYEEIEKDLLVGRARSHRARPVGRCGFVWKGRPSVTECVPAAAGSDRHRRQVAGQSTGDD